jgi:hypothetical protein
MANVCKKHELASIDGIPEFKVIWEGIHSRVVTRRSTLVLFAEVCGPDDILSGCWNDIRDCAVAALAAAIGTAGLATLRQSRAGNPGFQSRFPGVSGGETWRSRQRTQRLSQR